jgi:hypothetical protein
MITPYKTGIILLLMLFALSADAQHKEHDAVIHLIKKKIQALANKWNLTIRF